MKEWSPNEWALFFGAISANLVLIIHALASWLGRKESREQNREILEQVSEVKGQVTGLSTGTGDGGKP